MLLKLLGVLLVLKSSSHLKLFILNSKYDAQPQTEQRNFRPLSNLWEPESLANSTTVVDNLSYLFGLTPLGVVVPQIRVRAFQHPLCDKRSKYCLRRKWSLYRCS